MSSARSVDALVIQAPAKVNLYLEVLGKRSDGYHELETLMVAVSLYDTLEFKEDDSDQIHLSCDHPDLDCGPTNLIQRAARLLQEETGCRRGARLQLTKRIPMAAGLAGGSTDAAATLTGLNQLWGLGLERTELAALGARLGSDVPFFFALPAAWCTGRGEQIAPLTLGRELWFVLLCPPFGLSTAEVYRQVQVPAVPERGDAVREALASGDIATLGRRLHNRLQEAAQRLRPELAAYLALLAEQQPAGCLMSGSGSTLFALVEDAAAAQRLAHAVTRRGEESVTSGQVDRGRMETSATVETTVVQSCS